MKKSSEVNRSFRRPQGPKGRRAAQVPTAQERCEDGVVHISDVRAARHRLPSANVITTAVELFGLLSNTTRVRLLLALSPIEDNSEPELCVCDLAAVSGASESMTSHQLRLLRMAGLVEFRRSGKRALYRLKPGPQAHLLLDAFEYAGTR